jgi:hypothetical protein
MIRNIPNRYSINDLAEEIDEDFKNLYDFLYLPCDFNVILSPKRRINAMLAMVSLISSQLKPFQNFIQNFINRSGENLKVKK